MSGRHGANIPDIRDLATSLTSVVTAIDSLNIAIGQAFPNRETYSGLAGVRFDRPVRICEQDVQEITIYNPGPATLALGGPSTTRATIAPGETQTFHLGGGRELWARAVTGVGSLSFVAKRNLSGALTATISDVTNIATGVDFLGFVFFNGNQAVVMDTFVDGSFSIFRPGTTSRFDYDVNGDEGIDFAPRARDAVTGGTNVIGIDENTNDLYRIDVAQEIATNLFSIPGAFETNHQVLPIKTPVFEGYGISTRETDGDFYLVDANGVLVLQINGTELDLTGRGNAYLSSRYLVVEDEDTGTDEIHVVDLSAGTFETVENASGLAVAYEEIFVFKTSSGAAPKIVPYDTLIPEAPALELGGDTSIFTSGPRRPFGLLDDVGDQNFLIAWDTGDIAPVASADNGQDLDAGRSRIKENAGSTLTLTEQSTGVEVASLDLGTPDLFNGLIFFNPYTPQIVYQDTTTQDVFTAVVDIGWDPDANL